MSTAAVTPQLDTVQHPTLGPLKFPRDMGFDERNKIIEDMEATDSHQAEVAKGKEFKPGFAEGVSGAATGIDSPETLTAAEESAKPSLKDFAITATGLKPLIMLGGMVKDYGTNLWNRSKEALTEARDAGEDIGNGQPVLPALGKAALGGYQAFNAAIPLVGEQANKVGEDVAKKNYGSAFGRGLTTLALMGLSGREAGAEVPDVAPVRSTVESAGRLTKKVASAPIIRHLPGARTARMVAKDAIDLTQRPAEFPGASLPAHPGEFPGAHLPAHPGEFPGAPFPEAPPVPTPFQPSDTPAPIRLGPGQVPADIIGATNDRALPAGQGIRTTPRALLPASTEAPPVQSPSLSPKLAPPHIELPARFTPRYDLMEDKAFQDSANADLERHGRRAFKEERDQFEAGNKVDVPKGELTKQFREGIGKPEELSPGWSRPVPVRSAPLRMVGSSAGASADTNYFQAARQALGEKASVSDAAQLAQKLKESGIAPGASLEELLRKSIELAKQRKK